MKHLLSLLVATCTLSSLSAQKTVTAALLYEAGLEYGGDELLTLQFTNGEEQVMLAGQGDYASIGGEFRLTKIRDRVWRLCIDLFHPGLHFSSRATFWKLVWHFFHLRCTR